MQAEIADTGRSHEPRTFQAHRSRRIRPPSKILEPKTPRQPEPKLHFIRGSQIACSSRACFATQIARNYKPFTAREWAEWRLLCKRKDVSRWIGDFLDSGAAATYFVTVSFGRDVTEEEVKRRALRWLRKVRGYREVYLVAAWVRLIEPSRGGGWHVHALVRLVGEDILWERQQLGLESKQAQERGIFGRYRIEPVHSAVAMARYFVKTFRVGAERCSGQPVTFSQNVEKRRWWQAVERYEPVADTNAELERWAAGIVNSPVFQAALDELINQMC
jgi:hypothetical protein